MALACDITTELHRIGKPELSIKGWTTVPPAILPRDPGTHDRRHFPALSERVAGNTWLVRVALAVSLGRADPLQPDLLSRLTADRPINVVQRDGKTKQESH